MSIVTRLQVLVGACLFEIIAYTGNLADACMFYVEKKLNCSVDFQNVEQIQSAKENGAPRQLVRTRSHLKVLGMHPPKTFRNLYQNV